MKLLRRIMGRLADAIKTGILMKWSTIKKAAASFSLAFVFLVIMCVVTYGNTLGFINTSNAIQHSHEVLNGLESTLSTILDAETDVRGFYIIGDESYLAPYDSAKARINGQVERLKDMTADNPNQQRRIPILELAITAKFDVLSEVIKERRKEGFDPAQLLPIAGRGKATMDTVRKVIAEMQAEENGLLRARQADSNDSARNTLLALTGLVLIVSILLWLVYSLIRRDIAKQARVVAVIQKSEYKYRQLMEQASDGIIIFDRRGNLVNANPKACDTLGYTQEEVLRLNVRHILRKEDLSTTLRAIREIGNGGSELGECRLVRKDGSHFPVEISASPLDGGHLQVIARDITKRKQAELALRISEERSRTLLASLPHRVFFKDRNLVFASVNSQFAAELSIDPEDLIGKTDYDLVPEELANKYRADDMRIMETRQPEVIEEVNVSDGSERIVEVIKAPVISDNGDVMGILGMFTDITDRKRAEESLHENAALLTSIVQTQSDIAAHELDLDSVMNLITERALQLTGADGAIIELAEGDELVYRATSGAATPYLESRLKIESSLSGRCVQTGEVLRCDDTETDQRVDIVACRKISARSMIVVPLPYDLKVIGVLKVYSTKANKFGERDVNTLQLMAGLMASAMTHASEFEAKESALAALEESEARFRAAKEGSLDAFFLFKCLRDEQGKVVDFMFMDVNSPAQARLRLSREEIIGKTMSDLYPSVQKEGLLDRYAQVLESGQAIEMELQTNVPGSNPRWLYQQIVPLVEGIAITSKDVTERKRSEDALRESEERYSSVIAALEEGVVLQNADGSISAINSSVEYVLGLTAGQMLGMTSIYTKLLSIHEDGSPFPDKEHPARVTLRTGKPCSNVIMGIHKPDGQQAWLSINSQPLIKPGELKPYAVVSSFTDITQRKRAEDALHDLAIHDDLTGLYNRREMDRLLREELNRYHRYSQPVSLVMLDIDYFKAVNDIYGHQLGDDVLKWVAGLLQATIRETDKSARYGGEEFALILPGASAVEAASFAERIRQAIAAEAFIFTNEDGRVVHLPLTISLGVADTSPDTSTENSLIAAADVALYEAKRQGRNRTIQSGSFQTQEPNLAVS